MSQTSTYFDHLQSELVAASRRLHQERVVRADIDHPEAGEQGPLTQRSPETPRHADAPLRQIARHLRRPRPRTALTLTGAAGVAALAAVLLSIVGLGAGTQRALADWTPSPTTPASGQTAAAEAACIAKLPTSADIERARAGATGAAGSTATHPTLPALPTVRAGEWQVAVTDTRGPLTLFVLEAANGNAQGFCLSGPSGTYPTGVAFSDGGKGGGQPEAPPAGQVNVSSFGHSRTTPTGGEQLGEEYSTVSGQIGSEVTDVTLVLSDGTHVTASTANGQLLAWWPGWEDAVAVEVTTPSGTTTQQLYNPLTHSG